MYFWIIVVPILDIIYRILLSIQRYGKWLSLAYNFWKGWSAPKECWRNKVSLGCSRTEVASEIVTKIQEVLTPNLNDSVTVLWSITWINVSDNWWVVVSIWQWRINILELSSKRNTERNDFGLSVLWRVLAQNTSVVSVLLVFFLIESWWSLRAFDPFTSHNIVIAAKSAFWFWEYIRKFLHTISSDNYSSLTCRWSVSWEEWLDEKSVFSLFISLFNISSLPLTLDFTFQATGRAHAMGTSIIFSLAFEVILNCSFEDDIGVIIQILIPCLIKDFKTSCSSIDDVGRNLLGVHTWHRCQKNGDGKKYGLGKPFTSSDRAYVFTTL